MEAQKSLEELSVKQLIDKYNFIIPEIQREYVWGNNEFNILDKFFNDIKEIVKESKIESHDIKLTQEFEKMLELADNTDKENIRRIIEKFYSQKYLNIGFLYSYRPDYYVFNDRTDDVFLIDGQQRFTTLFLTLLYFSLKENENNLDFKNLFRFDEELESIAFDYRVRTLTHNFLIELVAQCKNLDDLVNIRTKTWFLDSFANDVTINAIIGCIYKLHECFKDEKTEYYEFIKNQIRFWHFRTEETSQGEELYITMNSRGQQLADNETLRAIFFENEDVKNNQIDWGSKWEIWQDFFWKNKPLNGNADYGFNQFLKWVNIIETFVNESFITKEDAEKKYKKLSSNLQVVKYVTLFTVEPYINFLIQLSVFHNEQFFDKIFFKENFSPNWLQNISQINLIKLLPTLMFGTKRPKEHLNRFIRFFSNIIKDTDISKNPDRHIIESINLTKLFLNDNYSDVIELVNYENEFPKMLSSEEVFKLSLYRKSSSEKRITLEEAFWEAEDFCKGKIGHLIQMTSYEGKIDKFSFNYYFDYSSIIDLDIDKFKELFLSYSELINNYETIWGNLLDSEVYYKSSDRQFILIDWEVNNSILKLALARKERTNENLDEFIISNEKKFLLTYRTEEDIKNERNYSKQLYIYYILHKRILNKWSWKKWNFGVYSGDEYPDVFSLFNHKFIFQSYNRQWRYNVGYEPGSGLWLQDNNDKDRNYISELLNWANNCYK